MFDVIDVFQGHNVETPGLSRNAPGMFDSERNLPDPYKAFKETLNHLNKLSVTRRLKNAVFRNSFIQPLKMKPISISIGPCDCVRPSGGEKTPVCFESLHECGPSTLTAKSCNISARFQVSIKINGGKAAVPLKLTFKYYLSTVKGGMLS